MKSPILYFPERKDTWSPVPAWTICYRDRSMTVNEDVLPPRLVRLLPVPYCQASPEKFIPFCEQAIILGYMR